MMVLVWSPLERPRQAFLLVAVVASLRLGSEGESMRLFSNFVLEVDVLTTCLKPV